METSAVTAEDASRRDNARIARQESSLAYLIIVGKGPTWSPADLEPLCRLLSRRFVGEIWAFGSYDADIRVERFRLRVVNEERSSVRLINLLLSGRRMLRWAAELRSARVSNLVVVSVDPFKSGLLAQYVAQRCKGVFICEINGVYADRNNLGSSNSVWIQSLLLAIRRRLGAFVISRATAVRLLFADQLRGFVRLPTRMLMRQFFDITPIERFYPGVEEPIILAVGFPFRVKGFDILCRAFHSIAAEHPGWKLVLIGHGAPEQLHAAGLEHPQIEPHPGVLQPELAEWMSRCAIFALPSRTEAMGRVLIEAGAAGKCRVASRIDGIPTVIEDGVDGLLVEKEDVGQLAATLARLIGDVPLRRQLGEAARARTQRDFSGEVYIAHFAELVSSALGQRGA
jgi:glycosyltransferase involved in cell wall biosynthesis